MKRIDDNKPITDNKIRKYNPSLIIEINKSDFWSPLTISLNFKRTIINIATDKIENIAETILAYVLVSVLKMSFLYMRAKAIVEINQTPFCI
jgi:hypothetical protein